MTGGASPSSSVDADTPSGVGDNGRRHDHLAAATAASSPDTRCGGVSGESSVACRGDDFNNGSGVCPPGGRGCLQEGGGRAPNCCCCCRRRRVSAPSPRGGCGENLKLATTATASGFNATAPTCVTFNATALGRGRQSSRLQRACHQK